METRRRAPLLILSPHLRTDRNQQQQPGADELGRQDQAQTSQRTQAEKNEMSPTAAAPAAAGG